MNCILSFGHMPPSEDPNVPTLFFAVAGEMIFIEAHATVMVLRNKLCCFCDLKMVSALCDSSADVVV
jgi:hypothetical protein